MSDPVQISSALLRRIDEFAERTGTSRSSIIEAALACYIEGADWNVLEVLKAIDEADGVDPVRPAAAGSPPSR